MKKSIDDKGELKKIVNELLVSAGEIIMQYRDHVGVVFDKEKNEIVTTADIASNNYLIEQLNIFYPNIEIYSEEGSSKSAAETRWILDPLDGTTPWVAGNSGFSISLALEQKGEVVVGAVYDPVMKELFYAEKNKGATRNGVAIKAVKDVTKEKMFLVFDWGNSDEKRREGVEYFNKLFIPEMFVRRILPQFAPALGLCRIAEGRVHALVCNDTWIEDHAAGALILQEAGGYVSNFYHRQKFNHKEHGIIACNDASTHARIVEFLDTAVTER